MPKFLVIRFSSIGDIVLTSPILRCLKKQIKDSQVHFFTKIEYQEILEGNPYVDKIFTIGGNSDLHQAVRELRQEKYDYVIDLHHNLRSSRVKSLLRRKSYSFPKLNFKKFLLTQFKVNKLARDLHVVDRYFEAVKAIGVNNDQLGLDYFIPKKDHIDFQRFGIKPGYVAFSIAAKYGTKRLPPDLIIDLIKMINKPVVLLGGIADMENARLIQMACPGTANVCGELLLSKTASVLQQSACVIAFDTGLMHIAAALEKPLLTIWGNTVREFGMYPYMPGNEKLFSIHEVDLKCRPCSKIGYNVCPKKHFKCMRNQDLEAIAREVNEL